VAQISKSLPSFIENPEKYLPKNMPECDVILVVGVHPDILISIPDVVKRTLAKAVIVPIENPSWCSPGLKMQIEDQLEEVGIESAFPKPFCELTESGKPILDSFIRRYKIGKPRIEVSIDGDKLSHTKVNISAPCGSTWYVAQQIKWGHISDLEEIVAKAHHAYPCTASMQVDPELKDTILHKAGYIIREAVKEAVYRAQKKSV
jgi:hypothetical protein